MQQHVFSITDIFPPQGGIIRSDRGDFKTGLVCSELRLGLALDLKSGLGYGQKYHP